MDHVLCRMWAHARGGLVKYGTRIRKALKLARQSHRGQWRDGDEALPYITHPIDVLNILRYEGRVTDEDLLCAALLHDVLEETETSVGTIAETCGERVASLVQELPRTEPSLEVSATLSPDELWTLRSQLLLDGIRAMSVDAQLVKLADRVSNLRGAHATRTGDRLARYQRQSVEILQIVPAEVSPALHATIDLLARSQS